MFSWMQRTMFLFMFSFILELFGSSFMGNQATAGEKSPVKNTNKKKENVGKTAPKLGDNQILNVAVITGPETGTTLAQQLGYFDQAGLTVNQITVPSSLTVFRGLASGTYDIALTQFDNVLARSGASSVNGATFIAVGFTDRNQYLPLYTISSVKSFADILALPLENRVFAVDAVDSAFALVLRAILEAQGLFLGTDPVNGYSFLSVGSAPNRIAAMQDGRAIGAILNPPFDVNGNALGFNNLGNQAESLPNYPGTTVNVNTNWAQLNESALVTFLCARNRALEFASKNPAQAISIVENFYQLGHADAIRRVNGLAFDGNLDSPKYLSLNEALDLRLHYGLTPVLGTDVKNFIDVEYDKKALKCKSDNCTGCVTLAAKKLAPVSKDPKK